MRRLTPTSFIGQTTRWGFAFESWPTFCATKVDDIMSVPPGLSFSMADFLARACTLDIEALAAEMAAYQGTDRLEDLVSALVNLKTTLEL